ncbi:targeting protein for XKLP2 [Arabidopsis thaliana]|uniref:Isoform 3 of Protein TPX2 n=1 Tax=Arabidopsis thaliana TaxID=3702 RepID=F4I2H7-3|nr:targeting protein for XKLP2 [Arabidopsis thaliana]AEE27612.1 targeting protein for XKLP2 [Arabidopsis thaliana]|eukprot:NP_171874.3 targeting protein for XKLP2 [Arabidopsis thaliana]
MEATAEESVSTLVTTMVDETYEFLAPRWFDFVNGETEDESRRAELWFQSALSCAPSPSVPRIKARRSFKVEAMCNFNEAEEETLKDKEPLEPVVPIVSLQSQPSQAKKAEVAPSKASTVKPSRISSKDAEVNNKTVDASDPTTEPIEDKENIAPACTPKPPMQFSLGAKSVDLKKQQTARKIASLLKNPSTLRPKNQSQAKGSHQKSVKGETNLNNIASTTNLIQENQAIKRQKLDDGKSRQILNPKPATLLHKTRNGLVNTGFNLCPSVTKHTPKENRKVYVREQIAPFVSTAELMKKFQTSTRDLFVQNRPKLTLTRPKEPEFVTSQRARPLRVKSSAELEEEMLAKIPKFKARPVNKKEFHLQTMARANQHAETSSIASTEVSKQHNDQKHHLTEPKSPVLQTMLRARPTIAKTTAELEQEELEKAPKFKAKPLNKKIFESKGEMGIFCNTKKHITIPQEFHFATDERISRPESVLDIFDKERGAEKEKKFYMELMYKKLGDVKARVPKANPYPYTTDYPVKREMVLINLTCSNSQVPPKPEPKQCTQPEPFQLESLVRHEEEMRREREERRRMETEEAQKRLFKAQPVIKEDPIPVPEKVRMPLTEIQEFNLHVEHRAVERADFDHKVSILFSHFSKQKNASITSEIDESILFWNQIKEKENQYKRYREESEAAKMVCNISNA